MRNTLGMLAICLLSLMVHAHCSKKSNGGGNVPVDPPPAGSKDVEFWLTKGDKSALLQKQDVTLSFGTSSNAFPSIEVDSATSFQEVDGFGYTLTGSSALLINKMGSTEKAALLQELFGSQPGSIGISYLRISMGASDLSPTVFSYNDLPAGETDPTLSKFNLSKDLDDLVPVLKQVLAINPQIRIMASPWSPPVWMKTNNSSIGGELKPEYYGVYAQYFVKYIQAMKAQGITIHAVTVQNEPHHDGNNPSMKMTAAQQTEFVKNHLGPAFQNAGIDTKIVIWDHNCDNPQYPITVLNDPDAKKYIDGSAFHLYAGNISALSTVKAAHPDKNLYFTEQWTGANGSFDGDLKWHIQNVIIGSMRHWSRIALEWNLANDPAYGPHTPGGCSECKGALTISGNSVNRNVSYYIVAHASKFVPAGSVRIGSNELAGLPNVAFKTPSGKKVLIVLNEGNSAVGFNLKYKGKWTLTSLPAGAVGTYVW